MNLDTGYLSYLCRTDTAAIQANIMRRFAPFNPVADQGYIYVKRGRSNVLAIAHLDTVLDSEYGTYQYDKVVTEENGVKITRYVNKGRKKNAYPAEYREFKTQAGKVINSISLDDRLGVWILIQVLNSMGIQPDLLFTTGEEVGMSTAQFFTPPADVKYNWMFQFDRRESKPVMYEYDDQDMRDRLRSVGVDATFGSFSDICYMGHLGIKGINWGTCYNNEHDESCHANLRQLQGSIQKFKKFWNRYHTTMMPHDATTKKYTTRMYAWDTDDFDYTTTRSTRKGLSKKENDIILAMNDDHDHEYYRLHRSLAGTPPETTEFCDTCGVSLYTGEVAGHKCGLCKDNAVRPRCEYCDNYLYGEEMFRGICQSCALTLREDEDFAMQVWKSELEKEDAGLWVTCADCATVISFKYSIYVAGVGHLCAKCNGNRKSVMKPVTIKALLTEKDDDGYAHNCWRCGQELLVDEYPYGVCGDCQEISALRGGG